MKLYGIYQTSLALLVSSGVGLVTCQASNAATIYSVLDLGSLGLQSKNIFVSGLNNSGQVVGVTLDESFDGRGFRTAPNSPINPATDYIDPQNGGFAAPAAINDLGQVVGIVPFGNPDWVLYEAFRTAPNSIVNAATDKLGLEYWSFANAINNSGQVVAGSSSRFSGTSSFRLAPNSQLNVQTDDIGSLGGTYPDGRTFMYRYTQASDINDLGQVVGSSLNTNLETHAFRTAPNSSINQATDDLGTLGGAESSAYGINNLGQVVGVSATASGEYHAFLTAPNSPINLATDDLGTLGGSYSSADDINNLGQVVGSSTTASGQRRAFLYEKGRMLDLNDLISPSLGVTLNYARRINDRGQIIAGFDTGDLSIPSPAFLLTPIVSTTAVPEPSLGLGLLAFTAIGGLITSKHAKN
ncbi:DUF3466 family protein [Nostoc sp. TCL26-01]|uniref:DUF3466 family protein n=1 Tax=Nostoc sp. TCL26-01 TaxID=2576904 RepID=UPI0015BC65E1|nr:DUF3466 family protein [Nostoc sp. TCL26-01]QLE58273.1 HAF repeat-containing protein [Nostoc sp. TCL26-01]